MPLRQLFKYVRFLLILLFALFLALCIFFALLQTKWAKEQIRAKLLAYLQQIGIPASVEEVNGKLPFTWRIKRADLLLSNNRELKLSQVTIRIAALPLFKGKVEIDYLRVENAEYSFSFAAQSKTEFSWEEGKALFREQISHALLPCAFSIQNLSISRLTFFNRERGTSLSVGVSGRAKIDQRKEEFSFALALSSPEQRQNYLEGTFHGSKRGNFIQGELKTQLDTLPPFLDLGIDAKAAVSLNLQGPWTTWEEILYSAPPTASPLTGEIQGMLADAKVPALEILSRTWTFKAKFALASNRDIDVDQFSLASDLIRIHGKGQWKSSLDKSNAALAFSFPDLSLLSPSFPMAGKAEGNIAFQERGFHGTFHTRDLRLGTFAAATTEGSLKGSVEGVEWEAEVAFASSDAKIPFRSSFAIEYAPRLHVSVHNFTVDIADAALSGYATYDLSQKLYDGALFANVSHLRRFAALLGEEDADGNMALECRLFTNGSEQSVKCIALASNLRYHEYLLDDITFSTEIQDLFEEPRGKFNLLAEKFFSPRLYLTRLNFGTQSDEEGWPFFLDAEGRMESPFQCFAKGFWRKENRLFSLELTEFAGELANAPFSLKFPAELEWGSSYLNLSPLDFRIGKGAFYTTFELSPQRSLCKWELSDFPLELFNCIRPRLSMSGHVTTAGFFDATTENLEGVWNAALGEAGVLHFGRKEPFRAKGTMQVHLNQKKAQIHTALTATEAQFLDFNASFPFQYQLYPFDIHLDQEAPAYAELIAEGRLQDLFDFVNIGTNSFTGLISTRLFLSHTLSDPALQGNLSWQNGTFDNYFTGISLNQIDGALEAKGDAIRLVHLTASDDKSGKLTGSGKIALKPKEHFPYAFEVELNHLHALGFDMIDCDLTGPLYLSGDTRNMYAQGNLLIDEALIQITESLPYEIPTLPVTYINRPSHLYSNTTTIGPNFTFHIDLELTAEGHVLAKGRGLNAELGGHVHLAGANANITANGALQLLKGEYQFSGKVFKLTEGEIIFNDKPTPSGYLNLNGTLTLPDLAITAMLRGPLTSPQLSFQSNPHLPTSSILARILFNKDISDITHPEAIQLASTLVSLSGTAGPDVMDTIRKSIGIDRLNIAPHPGSDEIALQIGKYLTRGIMITLSQSPTSSQVIVEVELPRGFVFQAETQEQQEGKFSLKWTKSY